MKIVHHHANGRFDWLISKHQSLNPSRESTSVLSGKYKRFRFVHPVNCTTKVSKFTSMKSQHEEGIKDPFFSIFHKEGN